MKPEWVALDCQGTDHDWGYRRGSRLVIARTSETGEARVIASMPGQADAVLLLDTESLKAALRHFMEGEE